LPGGAPRAPTRRSGPPLGKLAVVAGLLLAIFLVSRGCQSQGIDLTKDEAIAIAREQVDFEPDLEVVRFLRRGIRFKPYWAVSLSRRNAEGERTDVTVVVVDAATGAVVEVKRER
jgi:hypothetical protein